MTAAGAVPRRAGFSVVEGTITLILVSMLFYVAFQVMSHARRESQKGFWLQKAITELRNGTRAISQALKKTSYPTTIVKTGSQQLIQSYKEFRTYDDSGRLRFLKVKDSQDMDLKAVTGITAAQGGGRTLMVFPACQPETEQGAHQPGTITWYELRLEPGREFHRTGVADLLLVERVETYDTRPLPKRAYSLTTAFRESLAPVREKRLVADVDTVEIDLLSVEELLGIHVTTEGGVVTTMRKRYLVSVRVECAHPFDDNVRIADQCSVVIHIDAGMLAGGAAIEVLQILGSGPGAKARVRFNGNETTVGAGQDIAPGQRVVTVFAQGISVESQPGGRTRFYFLKK
ncbi:MAG: hypothetical protein GX442_20225 [Candidatus Riflebacteria bacterium]|nr:hypothetical protein [Candidatus Riflebacteria bacterium]